MRSALTKRHKTSPCVVLCVWLYANWGDGGISPAIMLKLKLSTITWNYSHSSAETAALLSTSLRMRGCGVRHRWIPLTKASDVEHWESRWFETHLPTPYHDTVMKSIHVESPPNQWIIPGDCHRRVYKTLVYVSHVPWDFVTAISKYDYIWRVGDKCLVATAICTEQDIDHMSMSCQWKLNLISLNFVRIFQNEHKMLAPKTKRVNLAISWPL